MYVKNNQFKKDKGNFQFILKGLILGLMTLFILVFLFAFVYNIFGFLSYTFISKFLLILNFLIIAYVGFYIAQRVKSNGWLNGGIGGMVYMIILILITYFNHSFSWSMILWLLLLGIITGSIGGILGINFK